MDQKGSQPKDMTMDDFKAKMSGKQIQAAATQAEIIADKQPDYTHMVNAMAGRGIDKAIAEKTRGVVEVDNWYVAKFSDGELRVGAFRAKEGRVLEPHEVMGYGDQRLQDGNLIQNPYVGGAYNKANIAAVLGVYASREEAEKRKAELLAERLEARKPELKYLAEELATALAKVMNAEAKAEVKAEPKK